MSLFLKDAIELSMGQPSLSAGPPLHPFCSSHHFFALQLFSIHTTTAAATYRSHAPPSDKASERFSFVRPTDRPAIKMSRGRLSDGRSLSAAAAAAAATLIHTLIHPDSIGRRRPTDRPAERVDALYRFVRRTERRTIAARSIICSID